MRDMFVDKSIAGDLYMPYPDHGLTPRIVAGSPERR